MGVLASWGVPNVPFLGVKNDSRDRCLVAVDGGAFLVLLAGCFALGRAGVLFADMGGIGVVCGIGY